MEQTTTKVSKASIILILMIVFFVLATYFSLKTINRSVDGPVDSFISCVSAGFPVLESFPRKCTDDSGKSYIEEVIPPINAITNEKVHVFYPVPGTAVDTPISFSGEARGTWFFEASFPVEVRNITGKTIARSHAEAKGEWMTEDFVRFEGDILLLPQTPAGQLFLVLQKDNPSGDPDKDEEVVIPINYFGQTR